MDKKSIDEAIKELMESQKDEMVKQLYASALEGLKKNLGWEVEQRLRTILTDWINIELKEDFTKLLNSQKEEILKEMSKGFINVAVKFGEMMQHTACKNLTSEWKMKDVIKKLFE